MSNQNFPFCISSGAWLFRFWSFLSRVFIIFALCCFQHRMSATNTGQETARLLVRCHQSGCIFCIYFPLVLWGLVAFLFPPLGTVKFIPLCACFSKWISSCVRTSFDVPNMPEHLVILHSNTVQPIPAAAWIHFYVPDICAGDVLTCISWWADADYKKCVFTHLGCEFSFCVWNPFPRLLLHRTDDLLLLVYYF